MKIIVWILIWYIIWFIVSDMTVYYKPQEITEEDKIMNYCTLTWYEKDTQKRLCKEFNDYIGQETDNRMKLRAIIDEIKSFNL